MCKAVEESFVRDGNIRTSAGVSTGIDLMRAFMAETAGDDAAGTIQFASEYCLSSKR